MDVVIALLLIAAFIVILVLKKRLDREKKDVERLSKFEVIGDARAEATRITEAAEAELNEAQTRAQEIKRHNDQLIRDARDSANQEAARISSEVEAELKDIRAKTKEIKGRNEVLIKDAHDLVKKIEAEARSKAEEIAGEAWGLKENAEQYEATVKAMKNIISGYGDEYLIPNASVLDELAEEYSHEEAGRDLKQVREQIKSMIKNSVAADCDYVEKVRKTTAIEFVLDAFNGKVDTIMSKVKHDNHGKLQQQLEDAYRIVNHNGKPFRDAKITENYYEIMVQQLKAAVTVQELKRRDQEEQRRIREAMREEQRALREIEKARKEAEKEEKLLLKAMREAENKLAGAAEEERLKLEAKLQELQGQLQEAEEKGQRAISMAQQTKQGHVYIISNVGSFGDEVFKIGLTRRFDPLERVKELGDASVPFPFDVHAMIHSKDAPKLEKELHTMFSLNQVNKVNPRKEFFRVSLTSIKERVEGLGLDSHWTMKAEAMEYRESLQLESNELNHGDVMH